MHISKQLLHEYVLHNVWLLQKLIKLELHMNTRLGLNFFQNRAELSQQTVNLKHLLLVREETHVHSVVEKDAHCVVRQLIAKAIFVGVVNPLSHPLQTITTISSGKAVRCGKKKSTFRCKDHTFSLLYRMDSVQKCVKCNVSYSPLGMCSRQPLRTLITASATVPVVVSSRPTEKQRDTLHQLAILMSWVRPNR